MKTFFTRLLHFIRQSMHGETPQQKAERKERKQFIKDHAKEVGAKYAAEFWDKCH